LEENSSNKKAASFTPCLNGTETYRIRKTKTSIAVSKCFEMFQINHPGPLVVWLVPRRDSFSLPP